jgi:hypothetical protein
MGYREDIARYQAQVDAVRRQKQQEEFAADYNQAVLGEQESLSLRQEVERQIAVTTDPTERQALMDEWHYHDAEVQRCGRERQARTPPSQPNPNDIAFLQKKAAYRQRFGQLADAVILRAHQQAVTPRNPNASSQSHPNTYGSGLRPGTPAYYKAINSYLELYGAALGAPYDPNEDGLTANEAARISGLSPQRYNQCSQQMANQRRFSWQNGNK